MQLLNILSYLYFCVQSQILNCIDIANSQEQLFWTNKAANRHNFMRLLELVLVYKHKCLLFMQELDRCVVCNFHDRNQYGFEKYL